MRFIELLDTIATCTSITAAIDVHGSIFEKQYTVKEYIRNEKGLHDMYVAKIQATETNSATLGFWVLLTDKSALCYSGIIEAEIEDNLQDPVSNENEYDPMMDCCNKCDPGADHELSLAQQEKWRAYFATFD